MADNTTIINSIGKRACDRRPPLLLQGDGDDDEPSLPVVLVADSPLPLNVVTMTAVLEGTAMRLLAVNMVNTEKRGQRDDCFCLETKVALEWGREYLLVLLGGLVSPNLPESEMIAKCV